MSTEVSGNAPPETTESRWDRQLLRGVLAVGAFAVIGGVLRIAQDAAVAWRYGAGPVTDAYFFLLSIVSWPVAVVLSTLTFVVAPAEAALRAQGEPALARFRSELFALVLVIALVALPLTYAALQTVIALPAVGLAPAIVVAAERASRELFAVTALGIVAALLSAWLISAARHVVTLVEAVPALTLVCVLAAAGPLPGTALYWGTTAGFAVQLLVLVLLLRADAALPRPRLGFASDAWCHAGPGGVAMFGGQVLFALVPLIDQLFAARMGDGAIASLGYANRLLVGLLGLTGLALQRASLPLLSRLVATSTPAVHTLAVGWAWRAGALGTLMAIAIVALADPIVGLIYERGRFSADDRAFVASLLRYGALQMPLYLIGIAAITALAAMGRHTFLALAAVVGLGVKLVGNAALADIAGPAGLQVASALMYASTSALAWVALRRNSTT